MFHLDRPVKRRCPWCCQTSPYFTTRVVNSLRIIVWCGILHKQGLGRFFYYSTVTADYYMHLLENDFLPEFLQCRMYQEVCIFPRDGGPVHFALMPSSKTGGWGKVQLRCQGLLALRTWRPSTSLCEAMWSSSSTTKAQRHTSTMSRSASRTISQSWATRCGKQSSMLMSIGSRSASMPKDFEKWKTQASHFCFPWATAWTAGWTKRFHFIHWRWR